ncbi:MAG TPA: hypothetical protein VIZ00_15900 [Streptosporangiaceae bacterium]
MLMNTLRNYHWSQHLRVRAEPAGRPARRQRFPQAVYWRRRLVALLIAMAVLSLLTWAFLGALGLSAGPSATSGHHGTSPAQGTAGGSGPSGAGQGGVGGSNTQSSNSNAGPAAGSGSRPRPCSRGDVVLSLLASQPAYASSGLPQFSIDVVGTGQSTCAFNVGARHLALVVRSGSVRVWSSADCPRGSGSLILDLQRGVPTTLSITWNRQASSPGCSGPSSAMPAGTYSATVSDGALTSNSVTFRLGG